jgi:transcriptional regulator with XRE-family HTH domain
MAKKNEIEELHSRIGSRLAELRKKAGYTNQESFAYQAGIARGQYSRYEAGTNITIDSLFKILKFLKISLKEFFSEGFE